jgi:glutamate racemase
LKSRPIGIFDSGIGGLTVANAISALLPNEQLIYFGDTAHLPYGDKSAKAIREYSREIMQFLVNQNCKLIVIACNSASASIGNSFQKWMPKEIPVINVIEPVVQHIAKQKHKKIGLIGTKRTIKSGVFPKHLKNTAPSKSIQSLATPLLAPMIEEGFYNNNISKAVINAYLENSRLKGIQSLVLACTHYPLIEKQIIELVGKQTTIVNSAHVVATKVKEVINKLHLENNQHKPLAHQFYISDYTPAFEQAANRFFGKKVKLTEHNLWKRQKV